MVFVFTRSYWRLMFFSNHIFRVYGQIFTNFAKIKKNVNNNSIGFFKNRRDLLIGFIWVVWLIFLLIFLNMKLFNQKWLPVRCFIPFSLNMSKYTFNICCHNVWKLQKTSCNFASCRSLLVLKFRRNFDNSTQKLYEMNYFFCFIEIFVFLMDLFCKYMEYLIVSVGGATNSGLGLDSFWILIINKYSDYNWAEYFSNKLRSIYDRPIYKKLRPNICILCLQRKLYFIEVIVFVFFFECFLFTSFVMLFAVSWLRLKNHLDFFLFITEYKQFFFLLYNACYEFE